MRENKRVERYREGRIDLGVHPWMVTGDGHVRHFSNPRCALGSMRDMRRFGLLPKAFDWERLKGEGVGSYSYEELLKEWG